MKPFFYICIGILLTLSARATEPPPLEEKAPIILGQGEQRFLKITGIHRYSLGSKIVRALEMRQHPASVLQKKGHSEGLLLKGISPGSTSLWIWKSDGSSEFHNIKVEKLLPSEKSKNLEKILTKLEETEVIYSPSGTVLRGTTNSLRESSILANIARLFPSEILDETEPSSALLDLGEARLNTRIRDLGSYAHLRVERVGPSLWVRGHLTHPKFLNQLQQQLRTCFPAVQIEVNALPDHAPTLYFKVFLLELKKNQFRSIGLGWPGSASSAFRVSTGAIQDLLQLDLTLQNIEIQGNGKVLSNPELVVRAPGEAELFAGGELPIRAQNKYSSQVSWKNYGLTLRLKVTHTAGEQIRLEIFTEVSHLDYKIEQDHVPGIQTNRMKTQVDARFGVPLLLSGLLQESLREEAKGLPFLRNIPVLGLLFGSEDYMNERSELVAILYPHSSPPPTTLKQGPRIFPKGLVPFPRNWVAPYEQESLQNSVEYPWNALQ